MALRVALVDDHRLFREGLRLLLERVPGLQITGEAGDAREAYQLIESSTPDVALLDVGLPGTSGIAAARELGRRGLRSRVLMLSMHADIDSVSQAIAAGAAGYALKVQPAMEIVSAIEAVGSGRSYLCAQIPRSAVEERLRRLRGTEGDHPLAGLSVREREIFDLLVRGYANDQISNQLCISVKTVETHRAHVFKKLNVHSMVELLRLAARHNLIRD